METIDLIICGGTIDKSYFPQREAFDFNKTHIKDMIKQAIMPNININIRFLFFKDSLDMDKKDKIRLVRACQESLSKRILIMHGTSNMQSSTEMVAKELGGGKTVVFFGSTLPYELLKSDAMFNFGTAIAACQLLSDGVYIAMHGTISEHDKIST
jgi:L-asparaginase